MEIDSDSDSGDIDITCQGWGRKRLNDGDEENGFDASPRNRPVKRRAVLSEHLWRLCLNDKSDVVQDDMSTASDVGSLQDIEEDYQPPSKCRPPHWRTMGTAPAVQLVDLEMDADASDGDRDRANANAQPQCPDGEESASEQEDGDTSSGVEAVPRLIPAATLPPFRTFSAPTGSVIDARLNELIRGHKLSRQSVDDSLAIIPFIPSSENAITSTSSSSPVHHIPPPPPPRPQRRRIDNSLQNNSSMEGVEVDNEEVVDTTLPSDPCTRFAFGFSGDNTVNQSSSEIGPHMNSIQTMLESPPPVCPASALPPNSFFYTAGENGFPGFGTPALVPNPELQPPLEPCFAGGSRQNFGQSFGQYNADSSLRIFVGHEGQYQQGDTL